MLQGLPDVLQNSCENLLDSMLFHCECRPDQRDQEHGHEINASTPMTVLVRDVTARGTGETLTHNL